MTAGAQHTSRTLLTSYHSAQVGIEWVLGKPPSTDDPDEFRKLLEPLPRKLNAKPPSDKATEAMALVDATPEGDGKMKEGDYVVQVCPAQH